MEAMQVTDGELMTRVREGDRQAFALLVERHKGPLVGYLSRLAGDRERAEDLAQEAFVRLFQAAGGYREEGRLTPYLFRIATNLLRSEERRRRRWQALRPLLSRNGNGGPPVAQERLLQGELHRRLRHELAHLPLHFRVPLVLFEVEDWTQADIARLLGCREGTVKSRIHRGRQRLRQALAPYLHGEDHAPRPTA
ncbi:MAG TPA: sigma-70 family RNA polymerase sigma factor [Thermoanaerobaculia bacterium]|nr:sigma-70 family RNA polymerase sigma factor [Thermoanaerobaculia bacterium]